MSISGVSNTVLLQQWNTASPQPQWQRVLQVRQDFNQLALDLQSGDLADARRAYADLQTLQASSLALTSIPTDLAALGHTLATNSLSEALSDSTLLQGDLSSALQNQSSAVAAHGGAGGLLLGYCGCLVSGIYRNGPGVLAWKPDQADLGRLDACDNVSLRNGSALQDVACRAKWDFVLAIAGLGYVALALCLNVESPLFVMTCLPGDL